MQGKPLRQIHEDWPHVLENATPLTLGQEISGSAAQLRYGEAHADAALPRLRERAIGGTAAGAGTKTRPEFALHMVSELSRLTAQDFSCAPNKF